MILLNDFFTLEDKQVTKGEISATLVINAGHKIFDGHFPNQPVVPGVCMMQMVKEIVESAMDKETNLVQATDMKFLAVIDPTQNNRIQATIKHSTVENGMINVQATLFKDELVHFKCKAQLQQLNS